MEPAANWFVSVLVEADFFDAGEDQKRICIKFFCKKFTGKVFFNDGTCTVKVNALLHDRNTAAATGNDDLAEYDFGEDEDDEDEAPEPDEDMTSEDGNKEDEV